MFSRITCHYKKKEYKVIQLRSRKEYLVFDCIAIVLSFLKSRTLLTNCSLKGMIVGAILVSHSCGWKFFAGVTTIAGGKSNVAGYRDGPSEDAKFSNDFDVVYVRPTCSLLVIDRGNAALRQISLNQEDCDYQYSTISSTGLDP